MKISREEVLRVAELAHLELSEAEVAKYLTQLDSILDYAAKLNAVDTSNVEPMTQVVRRCGWRDWRSESDISGRCCGSLRYFAGSFGEGAGCGCALF